MATSLTTAQELIAPSSIPEGPSWPDVHGTPTNPSRNDAVLPLPDAQFQQKRSKKLSLSFPILLPTGAMLPHRSTGSTPTLNQSPVRASHCFDPSTPVSARPLPSPDNQSDPLDESPDFLTLIASQERKVMELKEELCKAETELAALKRQWTTFEAKKKQTEIRTKTVRMGPVSPKTSVDLDAAERTRRREAREARLKELQGTGDDLGRSNSGKRNGQRVFTGSHTRALSLLQNTADAHPHTSTETMSRQKVKIRGDTGRIATKENTDPSEPGLSVSNLPARPSVSRQPTLQDLLASTALPSPVKLGRTYKDLAAASKKSLPPGTDEVLKQGKQVYQGLNQGFWNFVEDIRQATVGDEAVQPEPQPERVISKKKSQKKIIDEVQTCDKHGRGESERHLARDAHKQDKDNFWSEFGLSTPKSKKVPPTSRRDSEVKAGRTHDHESHSSTDSRRPPSLLADLMDINEDDEAWDNWPMESPVSTRKDVRTRSSLDSETTPVSSISGEPSVKDDKFSRSRISGDTTSWAELTH